jgi:hypothetical protein
MDLMLDFMFQVIDVDGFNAEFGCSQVAWNRVSMCKFQIYK